MCNWIKLSDRLPDNFDLVFLANDTGATTGCYAPNMKQWYDEYMYAMTVENITHWAVITLPGKED